MMVSHYVPILAKLSARRQAEVDDAVYVIYAEDLAAESIPVADVEAVCARLGKQPREPYQTAFPPIGDILQACREIRQNRAQQQRALEDRERNARLLPAPLSREEASTWLARIKAAAHGQAVPE